MKRIVIKSIAIAALVFVSVAAMAQDGGGRQGGGRRGGGFGFGQGRGGPQTGAMLLFRNDVQADLQLTDDQKTKLGELRPARGAGRRNGGGGGAGAGGNGGGAGANGGGREAAEARRAEMQKKVAEILTPEQSKRLKEIGIQLAGVQAVVDPEVQKDLGLDTAQLDKIKSIQSKYQEAMTSVRQRMRNQEIDREKAMEAMKTNNDTLKSEIEKVLTPAQSEKLKTLGGKPFKAEEQTRRGGGGRQ